MGTNPGCLPRYLAPSSTGDFGHTRYQASSVPARSGVRFHNLWHVEKCLLAQPSDMRLSVRWPFVPAPTCWVEAA